GTAGLGGTTLVGALPKPSASTGMSSPIAIIVGRFATSGNRPEGARGSAGGGAGATGGAAVSSRPALVNFGGRVAAGRAGGDGGGPACAGAGAAGAGDIAVGGAAGAG